MKGCLLFKIFICLIAFHSFSSGFDTDTRKDFGGKVALYPKPLTVVGCDVDGRVNWLVVGHTGIIGHDKIVLSMRDNHYSNKGIMKNKKLSVNLISRELLKKADYVGSVSGAKVDKSKVFEYVYGKGGSPVIIDSPISMECVVVDHFKDNDFDNFICTVSNTYVDEKYLNEKGQIDYKKLKPVLFSFRTYEYLATGEILGNCLRLEEKSMMCAKEPMSSDGIVRLSKIEVHEKYLDEYMEFAKEVGEVSLRTEPGVLTMYAMQEEKNPCMITILETYSSQDAYKAHISSKHFQKYKQGTLHMVKSLVLSDQKVLNPANKIVNFME